MPEPGAAPIRRAARTAPTARRWQFYERPALTRGPFFCASPGRALAASLSSAYAIYALDFPLQAATHAPHAMPSTLVPERRRTGSPTAV